MESATLTIRMLTSEPLPQAGSELQVKGMAGRYHVKIKWVLAVQEHSDGTVSVEVYATRALIEEQTTGRQPREVKPVARSLTDEEQDH